MSIHLIDQHPGETIKLFLVRHWIIFLPKVLLFLFLNIIPIVLFYLLFPGYIFDRNDFLTIIFILGGSLYYLAAWVVFFHAWLDYYLDSWIVTNERIINIEQHGFFHRIISEVPIDKVQDVSSAVKGFLATIFNFGDVNVQTAGEKQNILFDNVSHPTVVAHTIIELLKEYNETHKKDEIQKSK